MGNCESEENPTFRTINNDLLSSSNIYKNWENFNNNSSKSKNYDTIGGEKDVYRISRIKIKPQKIGTFEDLSNNIQENNTNNSTSSVSPGTEISDNYVLDNGNLDKFSRLKSLNSLKSSSSGSKFQVSTFRNKNNDKDFNKNNNEKKRIIRRKINSSDKALEIMTEEKLKKLNDNKNIDENNLNINFKKDIMANIVNEINFKCLKTIHGHKDKIVCATKLKKKRTFATGSYDNTIKVWNLNSYNCEKTIKEEGNVICLLEFEESMLLSGTNKNNINLWNISNLLLMFTFKGHQSWVNNLTKISNKYFASCSNDCNILIWDYYNKICVKVLQGHIDGVLSMITLSDGKLCSGGADLSIKIWDCLTGKCCTTLLGHKKWIKCLCQLTNNYLISGSDDKSIKLWSNNKCIHTFLGHSRSVRTLCQINDYLFASGSFDKTIKIWNIYHFNCIQTIHGHNDLLLIIIKMKSDEIISCSSDHEIKIWINN